MLIHIMYDMWQRATCTDHVFVWRMRFWASVCVNFSNTNSFDKPSDFDGIMRIVSRWSVSLRGARYRHLSQEFSQPSWESEHARAGSIAPLVRVFIVVVTVVVRMHLRHISCCCQRDGGKRLVGDVVRAHGHS